MSDKARNALSDALAELGFHQEAQYIRDEMDIPRVDAAIEVINAALREVPEARPLEEWHEDRGAVMWWTWRDGEWMGEAAWAGTPLDSDWPGYHTHWTQHPSFPAAMIDAAQEAE